MKTLIHVLLLALMPVTMHMACKAPTSSSSEATHAIRTSMNEQAEVKLVHVEEENKVEVYLDERLITAYIYPENMEKPVLYPINTREGTALTRSWPLDKARWRTRRPSPPCGNVAELRQRQWPRFLEQFLQKSLKNANTNTDTFGTQALNP